jgi:hypothetical protein
MGILRVDELSGLETPTAVTGSVEFDGSGDYLQTPDNEIFSMGTNDYTIEGWFYFTTLSSTQRLFGQRAADASELQMLLETNSSGELTYYFSISSSKNVGGVVATKVNTWHHIAVVRKDLVHTLYVDGVSVATNSTDTGSLDNRAQPFSIGRQGNYTSDAFNGHISNFRICKGTAVYTSNFTVPTHALEVTQDTVLLCCNNSDSVTASDHGTVGAAPPTLTANGDPAVSSINPGLTRDFTYGTEFRGVTTFDTQGYFVPPSGTTEQRGRGRGLFAGGEAPSKTNLIDFINISSSGIAASFGDLTIRRKELGGCASATRGVFAGGSSTGESPTPPLSRSNVIDYVTLASEGNATDFGDLIDFQDMIHCGLSNSTRGIFAGGEAPSAPSGSNVIQYVTIAALGNAQDFGDLIRGARESTGCASPTRGIIFGNGLGELQYITISTLGNAIDFGDHIFNSLAASCSDSTRGLIGGGTSPTLNTIQYITIATTGDAQDFGDLTVARSALAAVSNSIRGVFAGGNTGGNTIDYVTIQTTGNAVDWGDLPTEENQREQASGSDSHGGIS